MSKQTVTKQVQWQDLIVRNDVDLVFNLAQVQGWEESENLDLPANNYTSTSSC